MKAKKIWFEDNSLFVKFDNGQIIGNPLEWFPLLKNATIKQRENFTIDDDGIHWRELDEDLSFSGLFFYKNGFFEEWKRILENPKGEERVWERVGKKKNRPSLNVLD